MRFLIFLFLTVISTLVIAQPSPVYSWRVTRVFDGDTIGVLVPTFPPELKVKIRVRGIDTPEKRGLAKCQAERSLADKATTFTQDKINNARTISFDTLSWDKYGGRIVANVIIDEQDLGVQLINAGLARPYYGGYKASWCN